jgi:Nif-specific regulatory protein
MVATPIGEILVQNGVLTSKDLEECLKLQEKKGGRLGQLLIKEGYATPEEVFQALAIQVDLMLFRSIGDLDIGPEHQSTLSRTSMLEKLERLSMLFKTIMVISKEEDFDDLLNVIAREAAILCEAERSTIFLLSETGDELWAKVALGVEEAETLRIPANTGVAGYVVSKGETVLIDDAYKDDRFNPEVDDRTGYRTQNICCVPLKGRDERILGAFQILNKRAGSFTDEDVEMLVTLARHAAVTIERTLQYYALTDTVSNLSQENIWLRHEITDHFPFTAIVGRSQAIKKVLRLVEKAIDSSISVLITGESGTGKELIAKTIHFNSSRADKPFVPLNCAALAESLLEAELFGIEKGVATGVDKRPGKFELSHGGTIFLDEIGDMSVSLQAKLLRVLEEGEVYRVGGSKPIKVEVRVLAATNQDLRQAMEKGTFREDLFWRLNAFPIHLPPLREHADDIPALTEHFFLSFPLSRQKELKGIAPEVMDCFASYHWPGNVREIRNEMERAVTLADPSSLITPSLLSDHIRTATLPAAGRVSSSGGNLKDLVRQVEIEAIRQALADSGGNKRQAAETLGLTREGLRKKMIGYGIS